MADEEEDERYTPSVYEAQTHLQHTSGNTLLPGPIASLVSLAARSSSLYLRLGIFVGGLALDGARATTLTGLELSRAVIEAVLSRAAHDISDRNHGPDGQAQVENLLERSLAALHSTINKASFVASAGFHFSLAALSSASELSRHLLNTLDAIFGDTETSRAIATIITLIRREFQGPESSLESERVGTLDLIVGLTAFALLQRWGRKKTGRELLEKGAVEVVWDVVVLDRKSNNSGDRFAQNEFGQMHENPKSLGNSAALEDAPARTSFVSSIEDPFTIERVERARPSSRSTFNSTHFLQHREEDMAEEHLKQQIMSQLPPQATVSIRTETVTTKTMVVDITGAHIPEIVPPSGIMIVDEETTPRSITGVDTVGRRSSNFLTPHHRIVYQTVHNRQRSSFIEEADNIDEPVLDVSSEDTIATLSGGDSHNSTKVSSLSESLPTSPQPAEIPSPSPEDSFRLYESPTTSLTPDNLEAAVGTPSRPSITLTRPTTEGLMHSANQKRQRKPLHSATTNTGKESAKRDQGHPASQTHLAKHNDLERQEKDDKKTSIRRALKKRASNSGLANLWSKESALPRPTTSSKGKESRAPWSSSRFSGSEKAKAPSFIPMPRRTPGIIKTDGRTDASKNKLSGERYAEKASPSPAYQRPPSATGFYAVHERRRDSIVSQTDTYSIHSADQSRPESPLDFQSRPSMSNNLVRARSERSMSVLSQLEDAKSPSPKKRHHTRSKSAAPSIYSIASNSESSLIPTFYGDQTTNRYLPRSYLSSQMPHFDFVRDLIRFCRFSSASYGSNFLRFMGIAPANAMSPPQSQLIHHREHHSFSSHTGLPASAILLSSFVDPQGGSNAAGETGTGVPLVHYVSLDHESKAVILTCRGTLGFEDVLTDMTCDYDDLIWRGKPYKVHKGMHASARRLLELGGGRVMATIAIALEEFSDYGLVLCGHSLGGGVASLLAILLSEPNPLPAPESSFVIASRHAKTQRLLAQNASPATPGPSSITLPPGRPIHVYSYGPPATLSSSLRRATRGLITTIVNGQDFVPHLSLGNLPDLQAVALAFKTDSSNAKAEIRARVWESLTSGLAGKLYSRPSGLPSEDEDQWAWSALKSLRACMLAPKLVPPGDVFIVDTQRVLQRNAFMRPDPPQPAANTGSVGPDTSELVAHDSRTRTQSQQQALNQPTTPNGGNFSSDNTGGQYSSLGRPATRVTLRYVRDVEAMFGEIRFGGAMFADHSPGRYEESLASLKRGILEDDS